MLSKCLYDRMGFNFSEKFELDEEIQIAESDLSTYFCMQVEMHG